LEAFFLPDHVIFHEGDAGGYFYLILSGSVVLEIIGSGAHIEIQTLHEGDAMGWSSLLDTGRKHFQARAITRVTAAAFDAPTLRKLCEQEPRFGYAIMKRLVEVVTDRVYASRLRIEKAAALAV
jgi:CRP/FNR family cyclic AMP-dependent transcriptional regulator